MRPAGFRLQRSLAGDPGSLVLRIEPAELLYPLPGIDLGGVDVSLTVGGDVVQRRELPDLPPGPAEAASVSFEARSTMRTSPFMPSIM